MSFLWPKALWLLLAVPLLVIGYRDLLARRRRVAVELGSLSTLQTGAGKPIGRKRYVPPILFLIGVTFLLVGLARPEMNLDLPKREGTVILAFDTSNSMIADDLQPTRLQAAKRAALEFVDSQPSTIKLGVVAFSSAAFEVQTPTDVKDDVRTAIRRLRPDGGTSLGNAILTSLNAIKGKPLEIDPEALANGAGADAVEFLGSSAVVLLTDGENTAQLDPLAVTQVAADAGVRIYTIGIGSEGGAVVQIDGFSVATRLDEALLKEIADLSGGTYFRAEDAKSLNEIYGAIDLQLTIRGEDTEVTAIFAGIGLLFFLIAGALSMVWFGRVP